MKIKKISKEKHSGLVYNFHCTPNENYFSNGLLVHNCYKSNTPNGVNMSFETFKSILHKFPKDSNGNYGLNQIAFGVDAHATSNPDLWKMMKYCREHNIIPNLTVADISEDTAKKIVDVAGACSVSAYKHAKNFETCFESIDKLTTAFFASKKTTREQFETIFKDVAPIAYSKMNGMQLNIHFMISQETAQDAYYVMDAIKNDPRLKYVNALVFLGLKQKGRGEAFNVCGKSEFTDVLNYAFDHDIKLGFDTCLACRFKQYLLDFKPDRVEELSQSIETCCAGRISFYVNELGCFFPCSFMEHTDGDWKDGINMLNVVDFHKEIWHNDRVIKFTEHTTTCNSFGRGCSYYVV